MGTASGLEWLNGGTYGRKFKEDARRYYGSFVGFAGRGEMIPNDDCYAELDPKVKDKFGIPVLRFHWKWSEHELGQAAHMQKTAAEIIDAMGGRYATKPQGGDKAIKQGGVIIHEVGGAIMGNDPAKSVTNSFGQSWEMKNLFITDGATLCSNADKNPTLTIMALAWRSAEHMLGLMKRKEL
jgi:choline dehydrogenase-like flavoprotein